MNNLIISDIKARQILDSRGNPTVEADVILEGGAVGRAAVPSGASTGTFEALELRDGDDTRFGGKGVSKAVWNINSSIRDVLVGNTANQRTVDMLLLELDGTDNKSNLGANAILAVSLATAKAVANARRLPLYYYVAELAGTTELMSMPMPMMNLMNGGEHANWATDFQEYMVIPRSASTVAEAVRMGAEIFHSLKQVLKECDYPVTVGDEGGYAPRVKEGDNEPLDLITLAATRAGYQMGRDVVLAMDIASSEFYENGKYVLKTSGEQKTAAEMISWYTDLAEKYAVASIEDGLAESDWQNWRELTDRFGNKLQIVGDDLFVTNTQLLQRGIDEHVANSILVKPNQIGSLSETIDAVMLAKKAGYTTIVSHRSGETEDTTIAHLAVGLGAGQIKTGSLSRSERICKYNELMRIEETNPKLKLLDPFSR